MQIIDMAIMANRRVSAVGAMLVAVVWVLLLCTVVIVIVPSVV
jgi:hypothetical protein